MDPSCALMARGNNSCAACLRLQQRVEDVAMHEPKTLECFAGLNESAVPVRVGEKLVGYLQTGQVFLWRPTARRFSTFMREVGEREPNPKGKNSRRLIFSLESSRKSTTSRPSGWSRFFAEHLAAVSNQLVPGGYG